MGEAAPVVASEELGSLVRCNLIVTASNASDPIVFEHHLGPGPIVICDIAVPADVSPTVRGTRSDVVVTTGGCIRLPLGQAIETPGVELPFGNIFACEAETIVLGLAKRTGHFSFGPVDPKDVAEIGALAKQHGFVLGDDVSQSGGQLLYTT
jgi:predicted amino acid dehydrogenase